MTFGLETKPPFNYAKRLLFCYFFLAFFYPLSGLTKTIRSFEGPFYPILSSFVHVLLSFSSVLTNAFSVSLSNQYDLNF